ncbi:MAG: menaquinone biosynthesis protein [Pyrinomonadaceae bacterium]
MKGPRISASSYSNTAPLIWSFLYGSNHGAVEIILDNAPVRSAELLSQNRVDAALVPVIAYQQLDGVRLIADVCVGAKEKVRSVCLVTDGRELESVKSVSLDISSKTSACLTKIIFREFLGFEPIWKDAKPDLQAMLAESDCALLIGDPALTVSTTSGRNATVTERAKRLQTKTSTAIYKTFDLAELWKKHTGFGFVFAMWMTRNETCDINFAAARDEGLLHLNDIAANYKAEIGLSSEEMLEYLSENISYSTDDSMQKGLELYFELAAKHKLVKENKPLSFIEFARE